MDLDTYMNSLRGKRAAVLGVGVSNRPLIELLVDHGCAVTARDKKTDLGDFGAELAARGVALKLGEDYLADLTEDVIFRTPGLRPDLPPIAAAVERGSRMTSEMEAFFDVCPCPMIAVTGSDGKTTTTTIISELLRRAGRTVHVGGNIGHPLLSEAAAMAPTDWAVLELSSFQLMTMKKSPAIAVVTNLSPNHLDVHKDYAEYIAAKENIFTHQSARDLAVFNADNADTVRSAAKAPPAGAVVLPRQKEVDEGAFLRGTAVVARGRRASWVVMWTPPTSICQRPQHRELPGGHAAVDNLVAVRLSDFARTFGGVEHRIELVRERNGVRWYNDSIASSPSRTIAVRSFRKGHFDRWRQG